MLRRTLCSGCLLQYHRFFTYKALLTCVKFVQDNTLSVALYRLHCTQTPLVMEGYSKGHHFGGTELLLMPALVLHLALPLKWENDLIYNERWFNALLKKNYSSPHPGSNHKEVGRMVHLKSNGLSGYWRPETAGKEILLESLKTYWVVFWGPPAIASILLTTLLNLKICPSHIKHTGNNSFPFYFGTGELL